MPTREQLDRAHAEVERVRAAGTDGLDIQHVLPDYYFERYPKACLQGWGMVSMSVAPDGFVLPCQTAREIPRPGVPQRARPLARGHLGARPHLPALPRHRLDARAVPQLRPPRDRLRRLPLPGVPDDRRDVTATDPICELSPHHHLVAAALEEAAQNDPALVYRVMPRDAGSA